MCIRDSYKSAWKSQFLSGLMHPIMNLIGNLGYVAAVVMGSAYAAWGLITVGDIQSFIQYVRSFNQPISQVAQIANILQSTMAAGERVFEFLDEEEEEQTVPNPVSIQGIQGEVTFDHVPVSYTHLYSSISGERMASCLNGVFIGAAWIKPWVSPWKPS